jgi:hypothetical protein
MKIVELRVVPTTADLSGYSIQIQQGSKVLKSVKVA